MSELIQRPNLDRHDEIYQRLITMLEGLDEVQSLQAGARLILTLSNHIGDSAVIFQAIDIASGASMARFSETSKDQAARTRQFE